MLLRAIAGFPGFRKPFFMAFRFDRDGLGTWVPVTECRSGRRPALFSETIERRGFSERPGARRFFRSGEGSGPAPENGERNGRSG